VKMACAALGMYFVRFFRRAFCSLMAICFWILTRSCECEGARSASVQLLEGRRNSTKQADATAQVCPIVQELLVRSSNHLQAALLQGLPHRLHHLLNVVG